MCFVLKCKSLTGARQKDSSTPLNSEDPARSLTPALAEPPPKIHLACQASLQLYLCSFSGNSQAREMPHSAAYANLPASASCRPRSTPGSLSPPCSAAFCCFEAQPFHFSSAAIFTCKLKEEKAAEKKQQQTVGNQEVRRQIAFDTLLWPKKTQKQDTKEQFTNFQTFCTTWGDHKYFNLQKDKFPLGLVSIQAYQSHIYCKNNTKIKTLSLVQGPPGWEIIFLPHPQLKLLLFVLLTALGKLSPAAASEKDFDVSHGHCCALLLYNLPLLFP